MATQVLIIEDEPDVARMLGQVIEAAGDFRVRISLDPNELDAALSDQPPDLILTDLMMPAMDGFEVIRRVKAVDPDLPVVVVSAYASLENAVEAVKTGAFDFLAKPFRPETVELMLAKLTRDHGLRARAAEAARRAEAADPYLGALRGQGALMQRLRAWVLKVRNTEANVLIEGESGTGKELVARAIHGGRGPFVALNMAAIPEELAEAELFGYRRGAFTGAARDYPGLLVEASGGALFLDEVNAMSPGLQAKLLRVLQERSVRPVGDTRERKVSFRLLAASNQPLEGCVEQGTFRRDLYHRLNVLHVHLPPLRERAEDIPELAEHFLQHYARAHGARVRRLAPEVVGALMGHGWPGNVRELENVIEQAVILCDADSATLPLEVFPHNLGGQGWLGDTAHAAPSTGGTLAEVERHYILSVLKAADGNKAQAARTLGIDYKTLLRKLSAWQ
ncbi:sigma-54-dependent transcriptional regulator [Thioalkalivibrio sulfidiphilus]|uniref:sigma-54-dependent transcriptional regulator n=1 Tax=Thioalkalivibrio sulfidiphilus TaxID=1033854 RepID=UPI0003A8A192|nr:sigma-54 dependent transcriptional regulator [Thioalkalivibrio sulfidiphilus]